MNKYQEALDTLSRLVMFDEDGEEDNFLGEDYKEEIDTLQELINYMDFIDNFQTPDYLRVQNENEMLEKALNKACEEIQHQLDMNNRRMIINGKVMTQERWKEYLIESVKQ